MPRDEFRRDRRLAPRPHRQDAAGARAGRIFHPVRPPAAAVRHRHGRMQAVRVVSARHRWWSISASVPDQMTLFDTLARRSPEARVVDVSHQSYRKFFRVMQDIDFVAEARAPRSSRSSSTSRDRNADSYDEALHLRGPLRATARWSRSRIAFLGVPAEYDPQERRVSGLRDARAAPDHADARSGGAARARRSGNSP